MHKYEYMLPVIVAAQVVPLSASPPGGSFYYRHKLCSFLGTLSGRADLAVCLSEFSSFFFSRLLCLLAMQSLGPLASTRLVSDWDELGKLLGHLDLEDYLNTKLGICFC